MRPFMYKESDRVFVYYHLKNSSYEKNETTFGVFNYKWNNSHNNMFIIMVIIINTLQ